MDEIMYESVFAALSRHKVRYLIAGGIAVVLHGWTRFTKDLDLMLDLDDADNVLRFTQALKELNFVPHVPVDIEKLAVPAERQKWRGEKGALVLNLGHLSRPLERIDVFLANPIDFNEAFSRRKSIRVRDIEISVISLQDLISMKEKASRPQDIDDLEKLKAIQYRLGKE